MLVGRVRVRDHCVHAMHSAGRLLMTLANRCMLATDSMCIHRPTLGDCCVRSNAIKADNVWHWLAIVCKLKAMRAGHVCKLMSGISSRIAMGFGSRKPNIF